MPGSFLFSRGCPLSARTDPPNNKWAPAYASAHSPYLKHASSERAPYMSLVSSSFSMIQLFARITGRRNTRPRASDGMR